MSKSVSFKLNYANTDKTRTMSIEDIPNTAAIPNTVRTKVNAINASLAGGTASELANLFVSDDFDSQEGIGTLAKITNVEIKSVVETPITA